MKLIIDVMTYDGQAFLFDVDGNKPYYMHGTGEEVVPLNDYHLHPMNVQGIIPADKKDYEGQEFSTLEEAGKYVSRKSLEWTLNDLKNRCPQARTPELVAGIKKELK